MRIAIAVLLVVGCKDKPIDKADKLEAPQPEVTIAKDPPPAPPAPDDTKWMLTSDLPDLTLRTALEELLRPFSSQFAICVVVSAQGYIYATRAQDEAGARVTDDKLLSELAALERASGTRPLPMREETAKALNAMWICNRAPGAAPPTNVAPTILEAQRIAGDKNILPEDATKTEIQRSGKDRVVTTWKLCIDESGAVKETKVLKASGFAAYDAKIERELKTWAYKPYLTPVGRAVPVCTAVTFIYSQR